MRLFPPNKKDGKCCSYLWDYSSSTSDYMSREGLRVTFHFSSCLVIVVSRNRILKLEEL